MERGEIWLINLDPTVGAETKNFGEYPCTPNLGVQPSTMNCGWPHIELLLFSFPLQSFVQEEDQETDGDNTEHHQKHNTKGIHDWTSMPSNK